MNAHQTGFIALLLLIASQTHGQSETPHEHLYFGQKMPGIVPEVFAPDCVSKAGRSEYGVAFNTELDQMFFSAISEAGPQVYFSEYENNQWSTPEPLKFPDLDTSIYSSAVASDRGRSVFFSGAGQQSSQPIRYFKQEDSGWGEVKLLELAVGDDRVSFASMAWNLDVFFNNHADGKLYFAPRINRQYPKTIPLEHVEGTNGHIAATLDFILVDIPNGDDEIEHRDIAVHFKHQDGTWSKAFGLGSAVNSDNDESRPSLSPDGKFLFFTRDNRQAGSSDIYWVSAEVIEKARTIWRKGISDAAPKMAPEVAHIDRDNLSYGAEQALPDLHRAWIDVSPPEKSDGLAVGKLASVGESHGKVLAVAKQLADGELGNFDSLLIAHNNRLVFESYYNKGRANLPHFQASTTKGHTAMVVARAIQMGYLSMEDLHKPVVQLISELNQDELTDGATQITLHKAMSMRSGIRVDEQEQSQILSNNRELIGVNTVEEYLRDSDAIEPDTQTYNYQDADPRITLAVVENAVTGSVMDFIDKQVFGKLGIRNYGWQTDINGTPHAGSQSSLTSRDMLKLGLVVLNDGQWQGKQLFSADFLQQATSAHVKVNQDWMPEHYHYGYFWYQATVETDGRPLEMTFAWGAGGNRIIVVDALELVIVLTGHDREDKIMTEIEQKVIPAFVPAPG